MYASGIIINGFTPSSDRSTESLVEAIKQFKVDIVCVIDFESLIEDLRTLLKSSPEVLIIDTPKSNGVKAVKYDEKILHERYKDSFTKIGAHSQVFETISIFEKYQEYFRGKHYLAFSKQDQARLIEMVADPPHLLRNEFDPQDHKLSIDEFKIFEIRGLELSKSSL